MRHLLEVSKIQQLFPLFVPSPLRTRPHVDVADDGSMNGSVVSDFEEQITRVHTFTTDIEVKGFVEYWVFLFALDCCRLFTDPFRVVVQTRLDRHVYGKD